MTFSLSKQHAKFISLFAKSQKPILMKQIDCQNYFSVNKKPITANLVILHISLLFHLYFKEFNSITIITIIVIIEFIM